VCTVLKLLLLGQLSQPLVYISARSWPSLLNFPSLPPLVSRYTSHDVLSSRSLLSPRHWRVQALGAPDVYETAFPHVAPTPSFRFDPKAHLYPQETLQAPGLPERSHPDRFRSQSLAGRVLEDRLKRSPHVHPSLILLRRGEKKVPPHDTTNYEYILY
jgi:hypothetical protein